MFPIPSLSLVLPQPPTLRAKPLRGIPRLPEVPRVAEIRPPHSKIGIIDPWHALDADITEEFLRVTPDEDDLASASEYPIPSNETSLIARALATRIAWAQYKHDAALATVPRVGMGGGGGVALHWRNENAELLISVPSDRQKRITFYGETRDGASIEGSLKTHSTDPVDSIAQWLIDHDPRRRIHP